MTESQFLRNVETTLAQIETALDDADVAADCELSALVLTIEFEDGAKIVVNGQAPMQQLWLAARSGAMHFAFRDGRWFDVRSGAEFFEALSRIVSAQIGRRVELVSPSP